MVFDRIKHLKHYKGLGPLVADIISYVGRTALSALECGEYESKGEEHRRDVHLLSPLHARRPGLPLYGQSPRAVGE